MLVLAFSLQFSRSRAAALETQPIIITVLRVLYFVLGTFDFRL